MMKKNRRDRGKRRMPFLILSILSLCFLGLFILFVSPTTALPFFGWQVSAIFIFFPFLALLLFSVPTYLLTSKKHGVLLSGIGILYFGLLLADLRHPFFLILALALFFTLELLFTGQKRQ